ncbi:hypothetical protein CEXT_365601 [Caerostris extrusa]|uniref:Uncharacterized protein n=1 Tax=Caerostris extrusa TaxID=172846 RepID=A0AAV4XRG5_CAEEX|nr:hypothetical protein CEXT_365601 [Caerostris extrusa]
MGTRNKEGCQIIESVHGSGEAVKRNGFDSFYEAARAIIYVAPSNEIHIARRSQSSPEVSFYDYAQSESTIRHSVIAQNRLLIFPTPEALQDILEIRRFFNPFKHSGRAPLLNNGFSKPEGMSDY